MNWTDIYTKYKDIELMKEFGKFIFLQGGLFYPKKDIKDIWGYLICFAETKGWEIDLNDCQICKINDILNFEEDLDRFDIKDLETKKRMLWCADKFFEVQI